MSKKNGLKYCMVCLCKYAISMRDEYSKCDSEYWYWDAFVDFLFKLDILVF